MKLSKTADDSIGTIRNFRTTLQLIRFSSIREFEISQVQIS